MMTKRGTRKDDRPRSWKGAAGVLALEEWAMHRHFDIWLDKVEDDQQMFMILRDGEPAAAVIPVQAFETMIVIMHHLAQEDAAIGANVGKTVH